MSNKKTIVKIGIFGILLSVGVMLLPLKIERMEWGLAVTIAGTIISAFAFWITIIEIMEMKKTTDAVAEAVEENRKSILNLSQVSDISRHTQMINEIRGFINASKWELAHLRLLELYAILNEIKNNPKTYNTGPLDTVSHVSHTAEDLRLLNMAIQKTGELNPEQILNHLDEMVPFLSSVCVYLKNK